MTGAIVAVEVHQAGVIDGVDGIGAADQVNIAVAVEIAWCQAYQLVIRGEDRSLSEGLEGFTVSVDIVEARRGHTVIHTVPYHDQLQLRAARDDIGPTDAEG